VQKWKKLLESQRKELNDCRAEITSLKMHIEGSRSGKGMSVGHADHVQAQSSGNTTEEIKLSQVDTGSPEAKVSAASSAADSNNPGEIVQREESPVDSPSGETDLSGRRESDFEASKIGDRQSVAAMAFSEEAVQAEGNLPKSTISISHENGAVGVQRNTDTLSGESPNLDRSPFFKADNATITPPPEKMASLLLS